jgi:hypothetical protein
MLLHMTCYRCLVDLEVCLELLSLSWILVCLVKQTAVSSNTYIAVEKTSQ